MFDVTFESAMDLSLAKEKLFVAVSILTYLIILGAGLSVIQKSPVSKIRSWGVFLLLQFWYLWLIPVQLYLDYVTKSKVVSDIAQGEINFYRGGIEKISYSISRYYNVSLSDGTIIDTLHNRFCFDFSKLSDEKSVFIEARYILILLDAKKTVGCFIYANEISSRK